MRASLFVKYRTGAGTPHIFDTDTGQIIKATEPVYRILDHYGVLAPAQIAQKHPDMDNHDIQQAISDIESVKCQGCLSGHQPCVPSKVDTFLFKDKKMSLREWIDGHRFSLQLELTQQCNLRCEYCVYGSHYQRTRDHRSVHMSREMAEAAVSDFLEHAFSNCVIGLYGGEPLIEFDLIKHIVPFAEARAKELGKKVQWSMTTNGTLLTEEKVDFLCQHNISISVSMDGPRRLHDRYRRYQDGRGTFNTIIQNLKNFKERYPRYYSRGFVMTLAPPYDLQECAEFFHEWGEHFPMSRVSMVSDVDEQTFTDSIYTNTGCSAKGCGQSDCDTNSSHGTVREKDRAALRSMARKYADALMAYGAAKVASMPEYTFYQLLFGNDMLGIHHRLVTDIAQNEMPICPCIPGQTRLFCSAEGEYYPCERGAQVRTFKIGTVSQGLDHNKIRNLMDLSGRVMDCGNCSVRGICRICYAMWPQTDGRIDWSKFASLCVAHREHMAHELQVYTTVSEVKFDAFDVSGSKIRELNLIPVPSPLMKKHSQPTLHANTFEDQLY